MVEWMTDWLQDDFNWNYGISLAQTGSFKQAEEALLLVQSEKYKAEYCYISWLARCYISNGQPRNVRQTKEQNRNEHARGRKRMRKDERRKGKRRQKTFHILNTSATLFSAHIPNMSKILNIMWIEMKYGDVNTSDYELSLHPFEFRDENCLHHVKRTMLSAGMNL